ncbi:hypothetical protein ACFV19_29485 [Streptomyces griseoluteus]|uniref:hypothetical protein n=1 Tax=Streptomyces griseoluteus TaxID=29306 RepID=UPI0036A00F88
MAGTAGAAVAVAVAVAASVKAPYAQAGATVTSGRELRNAKGVEGVKHVGTGEYCVTFSDPEFNPAKILPSVSSLQRDRIVNYTWRAAATPATTSAKVWATDAAGNVADSWFCIIIH